MANKVTTFVKKNPGKSALFVGVGAVLFYVIYSSGSAPKASPATDAAGYSMPMIVGNSGYTDSQANSALAMQQLQAQQSMHGNELEAQLQALAMQTNLQRELAGMDLELNRDTLAMQYRVAELQSFENMYAMDVSADLSKFQISGQIESMRITAQHQYDLQELFTMGQVSVAQIQADTTKYALSQVTEQQLIQSTERILTTEMATNAATELQRILSGERVNVAQIGADKEVKLGRQEVEIAQINADLGKAQSRDQRKSNKYGAIGGIIGGIANIFCDVNIKSIGKCVSTEACLRAVENLPLDHWSYVAGSVPAENGDTRQHIGTYAQDFYRELGASDWLDRKQIEIVDLLGVLMGSIKELKNATAVT